jgi:hypothetical protein
MKRAFLIMIFTAIVVMAKAQQGNMMVKSDPRVDSLIAIHVAHNQTYPFIEGYRIQLFKDSGNDALDAAHDMMDKFHEFFPDIPAYLSFQEPYYRVRVGNFKTRLEALEQLEKIKRKYRNVWVIKDYIRFSDEQINQN